MADEILFYSVGEAYGGFSNFAPYPIALRGKRWPTSEHYFQAQKFLDPKAREEVRRASRLRPDWEAVKVGVMREALEAKFRQHEDLERLLLSTGDARLVEHTENDAFWGDGGDGSGRNMLGQLLMELRQKLRTE